MDEYQPGRGALHLDSVALQRFGCRALSARTEGPAALVWAQKISKNCFRDAAHFCDHMVIQFRRQHFRCSEAASEHIRCSVDMLRLHPRVGDIPETLARVKKRLSWAHSSTRRFCDLTTHGVFRLPCQPQRLALFGQLEPRA